MNCKSLYKFVFVTNIKYLTKIFCLIYYFLANMIYLKKSPKVSITYGFLKDFEYFPLDYK